MRLIFKICLISLCLCFGVSAAAQNEGYDVFIPIGKYLGKGDVESLSAWFDDNLEVTVISNGGNASKAQARQILKYFFASHTPHSFSITHSAGRANMKYVLGDLIAGGETFHVTIFVSCKDGTYKIQQLKIDRI